MDLLAYARRQADCRSFKGGWPGTRVGQIDEFLPYHIHHVDATDKKVV
jgi:hypothetical protein